MSMKRWVVAGLALFTCILMTASSGYAEINADVRMKLGSSAGIDDVEITNIATGSSTENGGGNFQVELVVSQQVDAGATFVGGFGIFGRSHQGSIGDAFFPSTDVEYDAGGLSATAGVGIKFNENFHMEGRVEFDLGSGKPTTALGFFGSSVREGSYTAAELIFGGYYTVSKPGLQVGLELGAQSFTGNFQITDTSGFWNDAKVKGSGGIVNLVIGWRF